MRIRQWLRGESSEVLTQEISPEQSGIREKREGGSEREGEGGEGRKKKRGKDYLNYHSGAA